MKNRMLTSVDRVIEAIGQAIAQARGLGEVDRRVALRLGGRRLQQLTDRASNNVTNWRTAHRFPPDTFLIITGELGRIGYEAPPRLWNIRAPKGSAAPRLGASAA